MALGGSNSDAVAQDQIKAFVERIMRMREEAKAINDDIREIYAEAKANGFDKTVLGKLVLYVEKRGKDANAVAEADAIFDLYLSAFDGSPSHTHAHAREERQHDVALNASISGALSEKQGNVDVTPEHDAATGEIPSESIQGKTDTAAQSPAQSDGDVSRSSGGDDTPATHRVMSMTPLEPREAGGLKGFGFTVSFEDQPVEPPSLHPAALNALKLRPYCLHADDLTKCAGVGKKHCGMCLAAHADSEGFSA